MSRRIVGYRYKCPRCGKITAGKKPKRGDGSAVLSRKHKNENGEYCEGRFEEAEWIEVPASWNAITFKVKPYRGKQ